ncbi:thaumatin-like protein [Lentinula detonsa]|uniref:Thaumatin-like protein n=1 Tax=Lentinula detonsa TaxID=2804962 RepID=A0AA38Q8S0_9AGAR|nr:thaumatin-like protein [Lentinula detonsa]
MKAFITMSSVIFSVFVAVSARTFTVKNNCQYTVWPAIFTDMNVGTDKPSMPTGWEAAPGNTSTFDVPDDWQSGRIWGRTDCDFSKPNASSCATGGCNGGLLCDEHSGTGVPPVTVAEWTLGKNGSPDNYDVSMVDGFNIPMSVVPTAGCQAIDCNTDLNINCPTQLQLKGASGKVVGCKSACDANLDGDPQNSPNCCSGSHNVPATCPPSGVQFYSYFKNGCKNAYAYAYDESSKTALWTCDSSKNADYAVTFCP